MRKGLLLTVLCALLAGCSVLKPSTPPAPAQPSAPVETPAETAPEKSAEPSGEGAEPERRRGPGGNDGMNFGMGAVGDRKVKTEADPEIAAVIRDNAEKFQQFTFDDPATGISLEYSLYIPENYSPEQKYPLLMYIPDASGASKSAKELVEQYYGADVWVTNEEQEKHPSFVLVPAFSVIVVDDAFQVSEEVEAAKNLLDHLTQAYSIDTDRLYTTGQSMGCMTSLYLNSKYPDLFAASLFVSGQWDIQALEPLQNATFFYITSDGDEKASGGQQEVREMLEQAGVPVSYGSWSAKNTAEEQNAAVAELLSAGASANLIRFEKGTCLAEGETGMEHNASFVYGYKIPAVRDWLFEQSR